MDSEKLKNLIGGNIAAYRKRAGLTQVGLANRLNYSDKAVSKWERGESMPDVLTLVQLAEQFSVSVNDLLSDPNALPEETGAVQKTMGKVVERTLKRKANKQIILWLSSILVWFVALLVYVIIASVGLPYGWLSFFLAVPADGIVMLSLRSAWRDFRWNRAYISIIMWGSLLSVYMLLLVLFQLNIWRMFLLGIPGQAAILLWFRMFCYDKCKEEQNGQENSSQADSGAKTGDDPSAN